MNVKISELIAYGSEGPALDFKREQYPLGSSPKKAEMLKDISAMVNHPSEEDKFIIVGVIEKEGRAHAFPGIDTLESEAKYQQYVRDNLEPMIQFEYLKVDYEGQQLAYFRIFGNIDRPYLFKSDIKNPADQKLVDFRIGDGYIRTGSSTKKLDRKDFDRLYVAKFRKKDRKNQILVIPSISEVIQGKLRGLPVIDVKVLNQSNEAITFDIELKVTSGDVELSQTVIREIGRKENERLSRIDPLGTALRSTDVYFPNLHVSIKAEGNVFLIKREKRNFAQGAVTISQHDQEDEIFMNDVILFGESGARVVGEVILRSDDFTEGPFIVPFNIEIPYGK